jgi:predicted transcriptional regulator
MAVIGELKPKGGGVMNAPETRQITVRLPEALYQAVKQLAKRRHTSVNRLAQESLERLARKELAVHLRAAYDELGKDAEESDVEPFLPAQSEVVNHDPA